MTRPLNDQLAPYVRAALTERIQRGVEHYFPDAVPDITDMLIRDIREEAEELAVRGFELGLRVALPPLSAEHLMAALSSRSSYLDADAKLAPGISRLAFNKMLRRAQEKLGWEIDYPEKGTPGVRPQKKDPETKAAA